jgi:endonuclease/exonuclease/phosphatase family metal-dependent hydrolase
VDRRVRAGERVLLVGDFNVTDREPGVDRLVAGLHDAHAEVGWGAGASWGPPDLRRRGIALVRIDRMLGGPGVVPTAARTDCRWHGSDHCLLTATLAVAP